MAITDHADHSNFDFILSRVSQVCGKLSEAYGIFVLPGIEITHVPPRWIPALAKEARKAGAKIIVVHGETLVEPVAEGTNLAAVQSDIDILAHPGLASAWRYPPARVTAWVTGTWRSWHAGMALPW